MKTECKRITAAPCVSQPSLVYLISVATYYFFVSENIHRGKREASQPTSLARNTKKFFVARLAGKEEAAYFAWAEAGFSVTRKITWFTQTNNVGGGAVLLL